MIKVTISGGGGVGKSHVADYFEMKASCNGLNCQVDDHGLFTKHSRFKSDLKKARSNHENRNADISIAVINNNESELTVKFENRVNYKTLQTLFKKE